jgi:hypothetical protein
MIANNATARLLLLTPLELHRCADAASQVVVSGFNVLRLPLKVGKAMGVHACLTQLKRTWH